LFFFSFKIVRYIFFLIIKHRYCTINIIKILYFFIKTTGTFNFFQLIYVNLKMDKMIALNAKLINRQDGNVENEGLIYC